MLIRLLRTKPYVILNLFVFCFRGSLNDGGFPLILTLKSERAVANLYPRLKGIVLIDCKSVFKCS